MTRRRARGALTRRTPASVPRRQLLVFVEGKRTEDGYVKFWWRRHRDKVIVNIDERHGTPMALVQLAIARKIREEREERRGRGSAHDEVWCVFDVDEHPNLEEAIQLADRNGVKVVVSNPCIELWFILHYEEQNAYIERKPAQMRAMELLQCKKTLTEAALESLAARHEGAMRRALALDEKHILDDNRPRSNPSSDVWRLVDKIVDPARP